MTITEEYIGHSGIKYIFEYHDTDSFESLEYAKCQQTYGVCFCNGEMVIGYGGNKQNWGLIGGTIEKGETFEQTFKREIKEESNMEVILCKPIGYQKMTDTRDNSYIYQLRYFAIVKPYGPFISDPAGGITEIKLIDPVDFKKYFYWGKIGDRIISRAIEMLKLHI
ncbi:MAG: NUDIX domain-containing protein [Candidatus Paceibacterota bacterium]|jgi:ADP-ribose pyrophosphatase YjhB (NUDIX family)